MAIPDYIFKKMGFYVQYNSLNSKNDKQKAFGERNHISRVNHALSQALRVSYYIEQTALKSCHLFSFWYA